MRNKIFNTPIGILGGTFDPIHNGHLQLAQSILDQLHLSEIQFIPAFDPPLHDPPIASATDRCQMVELAIQPFPHFKLDTRELDRQGKSYTIDTLLSLRHEFPITPLCFILGFDTFATLTSWKQWKQLMSLTHFILIPRPDARWMGNDNGRKNVQTPNLGVSTIIQQLLRDRETQNHEDLFNHLHGKIFRLPIVPIDISATKIREQLSQNEKPNGLPDAVYQYILKKKLYR